MQGNLQLNKNEIEMMEEVFQVISKYNGKIRSFGLQLIHSHFPIKTDEILYETHDKDTRMLTVRPIEVTSLSNDALATSWAKDENGTLVVCAFCCDSAVVTK